MCANAKAGSITSSSAYARHFAREELETTFVRDVIGRTSVGKDRMTATKLEETLGSELDTIVRKVDAGTYHFADYRQVLIVKGPDKRPREICIPTVRDALVLIALKQVLQDVMGSRCMTRKPQAVIAEVQRTIRAGRFDYFIRMDISEFYRHVNHERLEHVLWHNMRIRKPQVLQLVRAAVTAPSSPMDAPHGDPRTLGLPEGLPISNLLANAYLAGLDADCSENAHIRYWRYVDDIVILCDASYARRAQSFVDRRMKLLGLSLNAEKQQEGPISERTFEYLGYVFRGAELSVRKSSTRKIEQRIESLLKAYSRAPENEKERVLFELELAIKGCIWQDGEQEQRYGWAIYYSQVTRYSCFAQLDRAIRRMDSRLGTGLAAKLPKFGRMFYEVKFRIGKTNYIPRYGRTTPITEKRRLLVVLGVSVADRKDEWVERVFTQRIQRLCRKLDRDVGGGY